jgi:hypothetical protein
MKVINLYWTPATPISLIAGSIASIWTTAWKNFLSASACFAKRYKSKAVKAQSFLFVDLSE